LLSSYYIIFTEGTKARSHAPLGPILGDLSTIKAEETERIPPMTSIYNFSLENQQGEEIPLSHYQGKVLIVVNTATGCGLTPQYQGLQDLYQRYQDKGLEILDIPCNQFMGQAPGTAEEINSFCSLNYQTTFPRFAKAKVNGKEALPLYDWLKSQATGPLGKRIEWNFAKFVIDRQGQVAQRFSSKTEPAAMEDLIQELLDK
jgi:glutathione peroxidase